MLIRIKACDITDLITLQKISRQTFKETFQAYNSEADLNAYLDKAYNLDKLKNEIENQHSEFYLLYMQNELVAYCKLNWQNAQSEKYPANYLEIERLYVFKQFHKQGLGKRIVLFAKERAKKLGLNKIWLGVWEHNQNALKFYQHMGFQETDFHTFVVGSDPQTDLIMELDV